MNLNRLSYFAAVMDCGSFTQAAESLGVTKAVVSQHVAKLEIELKTALLVRTTRRIEPTAAGRLLYARSQIILSQAKDVFAEIAHSNAAPRGLLRIAAPNDYGASIVAPMAALFTQRYPECQIDLNLSDSRVDPVAHQIDLSIRVGWLEDSHLKARRIGSFRQHLVAAPQFVAMLSLSNPDDLRNAPFIANTALRDPLTWQFTGPGKEHCTVQMRKTLQIDNTPGVLAATLSGGGLSILPDYLVNAPLIDRRLVEFLPRWSLPAGGIHIVYSPVRFRLPKVVAFVEMLINFIRDSESTN